MKMTSFSIYFLVIILASANAISLSALASISSIKSEEPEDSSFNKKVLTKFVNFFKSWFVFKTCKFFSSEVKPRRESIFDFNWPQISQFFKNVFSSNFFETVKPQSLHKFIKATKMSISHRNKTRKLWNKEKTPKCVWKCDWEKNLTLRVSLLRTSIHLTSILEQYLSLEMCTVPLILDWWLPEKKIPFRTRSNNRSTITNWKFLGSHNFKA